MQITCWGSRGSIPVSGPKTKYYGGQTSCFAFQSTKAPKEMLVLDAGTGLYDLGQYLKTSPLQRIHLVLSHGHLDHVCGFPFFAPLFDSQYEIVLQAPSLPREELASLVHGLLHPPLSPVTWNAVRAKVRIESPAEREHVVAGWHTETFPVCHPGEAVGLRCTDHRGHTAVVINDNELGAFTPKHWQRLVEFCAHADLLVHDAHFTDEEIQQANGWGHSSPLQAAQLAAEARACCLGLAHHHPERSDGAVASIEAATREWLGQSPHPPACSAIAAGWSWKPGEPEKGVDSSAKFA